MKLDFDRLQTGARCLDSGRNRSCSSFWTLLVLAVFLQAGCATLEPADYPKVVERRALERWEALIKGDMQRAYSYLSPGTRQTMSFEAYRGSIRGGLWRKASVASVSCDGNVCKAMVDVTYDFRRAKGVTSQLSENWLIQDGNAWFVLQK